jgi:hypothetical protein
MPNFWCEREDTLFEEETFNEAFTLYNCKFCNRYVDDICDGPKLY